MKKAGHSGKDEWSLVRTCLESKKVLGLYKVQKQNVRSKEGVEVAAE